MFDNVYALLFDATSTCETVCDASCSMRFVACRAVKTCVGMFASSASTCSIFVHDTGVESRTGS